MPWLENIVDRISFDFLLIAPLCVLALLGAVSFFVRRRQPVLVLWVFVLSLVCGLIAFHRRGGGTLAFGYGCLLVALSLFCFSLLFFLRRKTGGKKGKEEARRMSEVRKGEAFLRGGRHVASDGEDDGISERKKGKYSDMVPSNKEIVSLRPAEDLQAAEGGERSASVGGQGNADVRLEHVFQVLKKLQNMKLSAGDRLETDVIRNMLNVYAAKGVLSAEETRALNNYLATLLKLMSKYSV